MKLDLEIIGIDKIGIDKDDVKKDELTAELQKLVDITRRTMEENKVTASFNLVQSIEARLIDANTGAIFMDPYWKFVNYGVQGVNKGESYNGYRFKAEIKPSVLHFENWLKFKNLPISAYAARGAVWSKGIKPRQFIEKSLQKYFEK